VTERPTGRHRASQKPSSSSLSTLTGPLSVVTGRMGTVRRSGVIIAMSSGLVATMALPAHAVSSGPAEVSGPQTASLPAVPAGDSSASAFFAAPEGGLLSLPPGLALEDGTVSAPDAATIDFDHTAFVAVPGPDGVAVNPAPAVDLGRAGARTGATTHGDLQLTDGGQAAAPAATRREARRTTTSSGSASPGSASSGGSSSSAASTQSASVASSSAAASAVAIASRYLGTPYRFGGSSPLGFDCSGLIQYVFAQLGKRLPRTAAEQAAAVRHVPRSAAKPGDLVLFPGGGHIALYLGGNMMLDAPHTGTVVQIRKIYSANVSFGRVV
jgi:peptidoglycan DL-endopeptidase CwlO